MPKILQVRPERCWRRDALLGHPSDEEGHREHMRKIGKPAEATAESSPMALHCDRGLVRLWRLDGPELGALDERGTAGREDGLPVTRRCPSCAARARVGIPVQWYRSEQQCRVERTLHRLAVETTQAGV